AKDTGQRLRESIGHFFDLGRFEDLVKARVRVARKHVHRGLPLLLSNRGPNPLLILVELGRLTDLLRGQGGVLHSHKHWRGLQSVPAALRDAECRQPHLAAFRWDNQAGVDGAVLLASLEAVSFLQKQRLVAAVFDLEFPYFGLFFLADRAQAALEPLVESNE